jgi:hypothetical protein
MQVRPMKRLADKTKLIKTNKPKVNKQITQEQYDKALAIVKAYQEQVLHNGNLIYPNRRSQETFIDLWKWLNVRTINGLQAHLLDNLKHLGVTKINTSNFDVNLLRYVDLNKICKLRNFGSSSYHELKALINSYKII